MAGEEFDSYCQALVRKYELLCCVIGRIQKSPFTPHSWFLGCAHDDQHGQKFAHITYYSENKEIPFILDHVVFNPIIASECIAI